MIDLKDNVISTIKKHNMIVGGEKIIIGVSGGADSVALLYSMWELSTLLDISVVAVHVNHGIRGNEAKRDEDFVENLCKKLNVEFICKHIDVPKLANEKKISTELAGRIARYEIFNDISIKTNANKIAVAHNKNDSVETIIMKLIRGAGLNGLKGISPTNDKIIRPLIECNRDDIEFYLKQNNIDYMTDSTNNSDVYTRNLVRNKILPLLKKINPNFINTVYQNSQMIKDDEDFINSIVTEHSKKCIKISQGDVCVDLNYISNLHTSIKTRLIIEAYKILTGTKQDLEQKHISIIINADSSGKKYDIGNGIVVTRDYDKLIFSKDEDCVEEFNYKVTNLTPVNHKDLCINFSLTDNNDISDKSYIYINYDLLKNKNLYVRNVHSGDRFIPSGMTNEKKLNRFFIDNKISKHIRATIPVLCTEKEIIAVLGMRVSEKYVVKKTTKEILKITISGGNHE